MADETQLRDPWLIAVWPGMGQVAVGAGGFLINKLGGKPVHELPANGLFEMQQVEVENGLASAVRMPRQLFFEWRNPNGARDLLIFVGEAQPAQGGYALCRKLLDYAQQRGCQRLFTFAAMATQLHPANDPRVFGVATGADALNELRRLDAEILKQGQISGLNGVLLAAGLERNIPGVCLMGELPFFAAGVPNPKASLAVLRTFTALADLSLDFSELERQAEVVERGLLELLERMKQAAREQGEEEGFTVPEFVQGDDDDDETEESAVDDATRSRIESLFDEAERDRDKAFRLKEELDRLGVFGQFEDRFLDLFKKAE